jgi:hypothetical protein
MFSRLRIRITSGRGSPQPFADAREATSISLLGHFEEVWRRTTSDGAYFDVVEVGLFGKVRRGPFRDYRIARGRMGPNFPVIELLVLGRDTATKINTGGVGF